MAVDIGEDAIDRPYTGGANETRINTGRASVYSGIITSIEIWSSWIDIEDLKVGTFYITNGNTLKCRDSEVIPGIIPSGSKVTKPVSIAVEFGDFIGCWYSAGNLELDMSGYIGDWHKIGDFCNPDDEATYTFQPGYGISLGGYIAPIAYKDTAARFRLWVQGYSDIATRFILTVLNYKDTATRFKLRVQAHQDTATRFILTVLNYKDVATRFKLLPPATHKDVSTRFYLYQPTWKTLQILGDIAELEAQVARLKLKPKAHFEI